MNWEWRKYYAKEKWDDFISDFSVTWFCFKYRIKVLIEWPSDMLWQWENGRRAPWRPPINADDEAMDYYDRTYGVKNYGR
jgi:hypothetical protein